MTVKIEEDLQITFTLSFSNQSDKTKVSKFLKEHNFILREEVNKPNIFNNSVQRQIDEEDVLDEKVQGELKLTFNLTDLYTQDTLADMLKGPDWKQAVREVDSKLRSIIKYDPSHDAMTIKALEILRSELYLELEERGLSVD